MSSFKFLRGYKGTLGMNPHTTNVTASIYTAQDVQQAQERRMERMRMSQALRNDTLLTYQQNRDEVDRRINQEHGEFSERILRSLDELEQRQIRLFQTTTTLTINPTLWTRVKIFGTKIKLILKETWRADPIGLIVVTALSTIILFIGIAKLFEA